MSEKIETKETPKNIYEKMTEVKIKLLGIKKTGKSDYIKNGYFELGDILPILTPALKEERLFMQTTFSATEQKAKLVIVDMDNIQDKIEYETKFADCSIKGIHEVQNLGAAQTYTRRYLILTAFDISDGDVLDGGAKPEEKKPKNKEPEKKPENKQEPDELGKLKREAWELIKKLPIDQRGIWQDSCNGADESILKEIIRELNLSLTKKEPEKKPEFEIF